MKSDYISKYHKSEKKPIIPKTKRHVWGKLNNKEIGILVVKSQDDVQKRIRCKLEIFRGKNEIMFCPFIYFIIVHV